MEAEGGIGALAVLLVPPMLVVEDEVGEAGVVTGSVDDAVMVDDVVLVDDVEVEGEVLFAP